jgi:hypothetical protein
VKKVADASGAKYSAASSSPSAALAPPVASKPAFMPTRSGASSAFNPLAGSRSGQQNRDVDEDGWGADAPPVTRSQLEKVQSAYKPTKVNMAELTKQTPEPSRFNGGARPKIESDSGNVVRGGYQPVGKVDIAAIRAQAQKKNDDRPTIVKGAYEPVGKVDIAAIRARAQKPSEDGHQEPSRPSETSSIEDAPKSLAERSAAFSQSERLTSLPKPKVANRFGSNTSSFAGTKAPTPGALGLQSTPSSAALAPVATASRTFADEGGKTPAQIWAEKKARQRGFSGAGDTAPPSTAAPITNQTSGGGEWKSGYSGKSWAPVPTNATGRSGAGSIGQQHTGEQEHEDDEASSSPAGGVNAIRDRFKGSAPMGASTLNRDTTGEDVPPPVNKASRPVGGVSMPGLPSRSFQHDEDENSARSIPPPPRVQRSPTPPTPEERDSSPVRIAMPVSRSKVPDIQAPEERLAASPLPTLSMGRNIPEEEDLTEEPIGHDPARGAGAAVAASTFGKNDSAQVNQDSRGTGTQAIVQYDYEKAEDNEIELIEGEHVTNIEMVDEDWWMGTNSKGESGLFPSNYVELVDIEEEEEVEEPAAPVSRPIAAAAPAPAASAPSSDEPTATALYDYEAAEDNELSFAEGATITGLVSHHLCPLESYTFGSSC